jgi:hypothetical protein
MKMSRRSLAMAALAAGCLVLALTVSTAVVVRRSGLRKKENDSGGLTTENALWEHADGSLCLQNRSFQSVTIDRAEPDVILVQEVIDGQMYTYEMINTDELRQEDPDRFDANWIDILDGVKYNCQVELLEDEFDTSSPTFLEHNQDGTSSWSVAYWTVDVGSDRQARVLHFPDEDSQDGVDSSVSMPITRVDDCAHNAIEGCDPVLEAGEDHVPSVEVSNEMVEDALRGTGHLDDDGTRRQLLQRHLASDFVPEITRTNWCGGGTSKSSPCPSSALASQISGYDLSADAACRRHDHGVKFKRLTGVVRTECMNDRDLAFATDNWAIEATYGFAGISGTWGCYAFGPYYCFKRWRYGRFCCGSRIRYGIGRYNSIARFDDWGYYEPLNQCANDLWQCTGSDCEALDPKAPETTSQCA